MKKLQEAGELGKAAAKLRAQAEIKATSIKEEEQRVAASESKLKEVRSGYNKLLNTRRIILYSPMQP